MISTPCPVLCTYLSLCNISAINLFPVVNECAIIFFHSLPPEMHPDYQSQFYQNNALHILLPNSDNLYVITHSKAPPEIPFLKNPRLPIEAALPVHLQFYSHLYHLR